MLADFPAIPILLSTDMEASKRFYQDTLGLPLLDETEERMLFKCGGDTRLIVSRSSVGTSDTQTQMVWRVPDIRAALADLRARGVQVEEYSAPEPVTTDGIADMGHSWSAWFIDPSRNVLAIIEPKR
ncbi:MAG: VOC family protein [Chloroflexi bacterium]|nr:MAG: VOC family protein [Chloroflexota bacterium]